jgi:hypothetical protein
MGCQLDALISGHIFGGNVRARCREGTGRQIEGGTTDLRKARHTSNIGIDNENARVIAEIGAGGGSLGDCLVTRLVQGVACVGRA